MNNPAICMLLLVATCLADHGRHGPKAASLTECLDQINQGPEPEGESPGVNPWKEAHECMQDCMETTSRGVCSSLIDHEEMHSLYRDMKQAVAECASESGLCSEEPLPRPDPESHEHSASHEGHHGDHHKGPGGHMKAVDAELEQRDPEAYAELQACKAQCPHPMHPGPGGRAGRREGGDKPEHGHGHHKHGHGGCIKEFCPCDVVKECKNSVKTNMEARFEDHQRKKAQMCTCILTGNPDEDIDEFCEALIEDHVHEDRPCPPQ